MKIHLSIGNYEFIEAEVNTVQEAEELSQEVKSVFELKDGLSEKEFNQALDRYLTDGTGDTETYIAMSREQKGIIQAIKRAYKRLGTLGDKD
jgi:hypothetical protein